MIGLLCFVLAVLASPELESSPPRPAPLRYGGLRGAGSRSQRCRRVTFQLCTNRDFSTWLQQNPDLQNFKTVDREPHIWSCLFIVGRASHSHKAFSAGKADLAVVRGDVGDLSQAQAVVVVSHVVILIIAPPGSAIDSVDKLKGRRVGVIGGDANSKVVDVLSREFGIDRAKVFKDVAMPDARRALQSKEVNALLVVIPLTEKYLSLVRDFFQQGPKALPVLIPIESAAAIAQAERAYESFDVPKGTLRGSPPIPEEDLTTLRTTLYLVANKKLGTDLVTSLTQTIMRVRRDLLAEQPIFAQITAPSTDADAHLPLHPGAAAFYNGTQQSFMDEYGNWIY
jgi:TRAP-type uncharacterized transport system substrate-binding protein